jgi:two-component system, response regulator YesN
MESKWLIADRDLNEREGLKWLLKSSSIPVAEIYLSTNYQDFVTLFEQKTPDVVLVELDMMSLSEWSRFQELMKIYQPALLVTSAEATFEKARLAITMQAIDLMIKPFSPAIVVKAFQNAFRQAEKKINSKTDSLLNSKKNISYEDFFLPQATFCEDFKLAAFTTENIDTIAALHPFLLDFPFKDQVDLFPMNDTVLIVFNASCSDMREQCQKAMRKWEEMFSEPLAAVVNGSRERKTLRDLYIEVKKMLSFTYYRGYRQVVEFKAAPDWKHVDPFLTPPEQRAWIDFLASFDLESIKKWLYKEFLQLQEPYPDPGLVRIRLTSILAQVRRYMKTYNLNDLEECEREYRYIFNSILYDSILYRSVQNLILFIQEIVSIAESKIGDFKQDPVERGMAYIEANFTKSDLRLEDVAKFVERNPAYYSHLLINKTGNSFIDILAMFRMKEAKRLLKETRKPIKEISMLVGFRNANYFSRSFKRYFGVSPKEYRLGR